MHATRSSIIVATMLAVLVVAISVHAASPMSIQYSPSNPKQNEPVTFNAMVQGGTAPYSYYWSFGDGAYASTNPVQHSYRSPGNYQVMVTVTDSNRPVPNSWQASVTVQVANPQISTSFTYSPSSPDTSSRVMFNGQASGGSGGYTYNWDFGDGQTAQGQSVQHTFTSARGYSVTLTVTDGNGDSAHSSQTVNVHQPGQKGPIFGNISDQMLLIGIALIVVAVAVVAIVVGAAASRRRRFGEPY